MEEKWTYQGKRIAESAETDGEGKNRIPGRRVEKRKGNFWKDYGYLFITAAAVILVFRVILQLAFVPSASMEDTIPTESLLISWQLPYLVSDPTPRHGDVVTFWSDEKGKLLVKRVIGVGGDQIAIYDGAVYRNGERLEEPYLKDVFNTGNYNDMIYTVPEGHLFFMGDNRGNSDDSRLWHEPFISVEKIHARVLVCIPLRTVAEWKGSGSAEPFKLYLPILGEIHTISS